MRERDPIDALFAKTLLEEFEDAGVSLPPAQRRRAKEINDRITALGQEFDKNIRDANVQAARSPIDESRGVPEAQCAQGQGATSRAACCSASTAPTYAR